MAATLDPVMRKFRAALDRAYGDRIERVVLFGSPDSDWDGAVFLKDMNDTGRECGVLAEIGTEILRNEGAVVNAAPMESGAWRELTNFMHEVRRDGIDL